MDTASSTENADSTTSVNDDIVALRAQVDALTGDRLSPVVVAGADYAQHVIDWVEAETERLSSRIRERPLTSLGIAALVGYLLGVLRRH